MGCFVASKSKEEVFLDPTIDSSPTIHGGILSMEKEDSLNLPPMKKPFDIIWKRHSNLENFHLEKGYNFGAYDRNDCDGRWRYLRSMTTFHGNRSYRDEPMVERRLMDRGDIVGREIDRKNGDGGLDPLMSSSVMFDPSCYGFGNLDDTFLVELNIVGFALEFDRNSLQHVFTVTSTRGRRHTMEFEGQGKNVCEN
ncbi:hypothetical protein M9H77_18114 [Catharanthus roseus]|uniref:Uncharacterized protein n=1 Tax=Catharanthus roseus TaxID=4058 RepID=A0ACC0B6J9_CATRO|nr:hypothetical protein M9H77_18114 [Catharanthus roseus]